MPYRQKEVKPYPLKQPQLQQLRTHPFERPQEKCKGTPEESEGIRLKLSTGQKEPIFDSSPFT